MNVINVRDRILVAAYSINPSAYMDKVDEVVNGVSIPWQERLPDVTRWSDVAGLLWAEEAGNSASSLKYVFRQAITSDDTKFMIEEAAKRQAGYHNTRGGYKFKKPWPGHKFKADSEDFSALLGTAHGTGIVHLISQHPKQMPKKMVEAVNIFATAKGKEYPGQYEYHMLWTLTD